LQFVDNIYEHKLRLDWWGWRQYDGDDNNNKTTIYKAP